MRGITGKMLKLNIHQLKESVRLGCSEEERAFPQIVEIDLEIGLNAHDCLVSDSIRDTVDYMAVVQVIKKLSQECSWKLLEKMAADIAGEIIASFKQASYVYITVKKNIVANCSGISASLTVNRPVN